ncbi:MAG: sigma-70 family RNA polymerase sigma factor [Planctomycetes bacterium]|nr:sigma-70 family RNA polymerase sigma factor [Planctomycetota bacterium]
MCIAQELTLADSTDSRSDEELVRSALAGEDEAFGLLVTKYSPGIFRMICLRVPDSDACEDLVQETFIRAWKALPGFRFGAKFFTWLYRIGMNATKEHQRKHARRRELDAELRLIEVRESPGADEALGKEEEREQIRRALESLPEEYRCALLLREWEEMSYAEISKVLGVPAGTVASRIARAREMLAERMTANEKL